MIVSIHDKKHATVGDIPGVHHHGIHLVVPYFEFTAQGRAQIASLITHNTPILNCFIL